jgi:hypothetical protein
MRFRAATWAIGVGAIGLGCVVVGRTANADDPSTKCALSYLSDYGAPFYDAETGEWTGRSQEEAVAQARNELPELHAQRKEARDTESFEMQPGVYDALSKLLERAQPDPTAGDRKGADTAGVAEWTYAENGEVSGKLLLRDLTARFDEDLPSYWVIDEKVILVPSGTCDTPAAKDAPPASRTDN